MSELRPLNTTRYHSDRPSALRFAQAQIHFIISNTKHLLKVRNGDKLLEKIICFQKQSFPLTDNQLSEVDRIYEKTMQGAGLPSFSATYKRGKK